MQCRHVLIAHFRCIVCPANHRVVAHTERIFGVVGKRGVRIGGASGQLFGLQAAECLLNHRLGLFRIEITDQYQCHVVRHVPSVVEFNQLAQTRIFQVFRQTDHISLVGVPCVDFGEQVLADVRLHIVLIHIVFLEHVLQLGLERTEYRVNQTVRVDGQPLVHVRSGERVVVAGHVVARERIHARRSDSVEQHKEVLHGGVFGFFHRGLVDFRGQLRTHFRVGSLCVLVVEFYYLFVVGLFFLPVECADALCALEKHVLQVVCQSGVFFRLVDRACADGYVARHIGLVVVFPQQNGHSVCQFVLSQSFSRLRLHTRRNGKQAQRCNYKLFHYQ